MPDEAVMSAFCCAPGDLEALLYDWHNAHRLIEQQANVGYWANQTRSSTRTLVLGAGTGRIVTSLAVSGNGLVVALDHNLARLRRIASSSRLARVCGDMRQLPLSQEFDEIVIPYSTFQLLPRDTYRRQAVQLAARLAGPAAGGDACPGGQAGDRTSPGGPRTAGAEKAGAAGAAAGVLGVD
jgi:hypothetical protein